MVMTERKFKILFIVSSYDVLSQSLHLHLLDRTFLRRCWEHNVSQKSTSPTAHQTKVIYKPVVTVELALSENTMTEAVERASPDLIICPYLTKKVPDKIFRNHCVLIVHPGPPGDIGLSSLQWLLLGDDGTCPNNTEAKIILNEADFIPAGRTHWGVTVFQANERVGAGPVWASVEFPFDLEEQQTKAQIYRQYIIPSALEAVDRAIEKLLDQGGTFPIPYTLSPPRISLVSAAGSTQFRPALKSNDITFDPRTETADTVGRKLRSCNDEPGLLSDCFGESLFLFGGLVERNGSLTRDIKGAIPGKVIGTRGGAVLLKCKEDAVWITQVRIPKKKGDGLRGKNPKIPAAMVLEGQCVLYGSRELNHVGWEKRLGTHQECWIDMRDEGKVAIVGWNFPNGCMSIRQCEKLVHLFLDLTPAKNPELKLVIIEGSELYFSHGINLNIIECSSNPQTETWGNINALSDVTLAILSLPFPTLAHIRGDASFGGVALAAACDSVYMTEGAILNPSYRSLGMFGSEYHTFTYLKRMGKRTTHKICLEMQLIGAKEAREAGLVDKVIKDEGELWERVKGFLFKDHKLACAPWSTLDNSRMGTLEDIKLAKERLLRNVDEFGSYREGELKHLREDLFGERADRFQKRRRNFVRGVTPTHTPFRLALHRRFCGWEEGGKIMMDEEEREDWFDLVSHEKSQTPPLEHSTKRDTIPSDPGSAIDTAESFDDQHSRGDEFENGTPEETIEFNWMIKPKMMFGSTEGDTDTIKNSPLTVKHLKVSTGTLKGTNTFEIQVPGSPTSNRSTHPSPIPKIKSLDNLHREKVRSHPLDFPLPPTSNAGTIPIATVDTRRRPRTANTCRVRMDMPMSPPLPPPTGELPPLPSEPTVSAIRHQLAIASNQKRTAASSANRPMLNLITDDRLRFRPTNACDPISKSADGYRWQSAHNIESAKKLEEVEAVFNALKTRQQKVSRERNRPMTSQGTPMFDKDEQFKRPNESAMPLSPQRTGPISSSQKPTEAQILPVHARTLKTPKSENHLKSRYKSDRGSSSSPTSGPPQAQGSAPPLPYSPSSPQFLYGSLQSQPQSPFGHLSPIISVFPAYNTIPIEGTKSESHATNGQQRYGKEMLHIQAQGRSEIVYVPSHSRGGIEGFGGSKERMKDDQIYMSPGLDAKVSQDSQTSSNQTSATALTESLPTNNMEGGSVRSKSPGLRATIRNMFSGDRQERGIRYDHRPSDREQERVREWEKEKQKQQRQIERQRERERKILILKSGRGLRRKGDVGISSDGVFATKSLTGVDSVRSSRGKGGPLGSYLGKWGSLKDEQGRGSKSMDSLERRKSMN